MMTACLFPPKHKPTSAASLEDLPYVSSLVKKDELDNSVSGKNGRFGGISPYTDTDVALAREYLVEMGKDPNHEIDGRLARHMMAEFARFLVVDNGELQLKDNTKGKDPIKDKWEAEKIKSKLETMQASCNALKARIVTLEQELAVARKIKPYEGDAVSFKRVRRIRDAE